MKSQQIGHADDWLITYADTITLLLCLFVVILSITVTRNAALEKLAYIPTVEKPSIPVSLAEDYRAFHKFVHSNEQIEDTTDDPRTISVDTPAALPSQAPSLQAKLSQAPSSMVSVVTPVSAPLIVDLPVWQGTVSVEDNASPFAETVNHLKSRGQAAIEQKRDDATTLEIGSAAFFSSGSATLSASGRVILLDVAADLKSDALQDYQITVEGHTDDTPISTSQFPSNWELSTARAAAVVHFLLDQGVASQRLRAAGYADTFPVEPNRNSDGNAIPENQARNRRVVIKLEKIQRQYQER
jgi:chemotaxis protein MotB